MSGTLRLRGATSGYSELQAPAVAADQTFVLPTAGGTLLTTDSPVPKLTLELGSASQPSLTFEGDTDTGLYSSGTNTLNLVTGGSNRLNITSGGAVGINTTSPSALLDVNGALRIRSTSIFDSTFQVGGDAQGGSAGTQIFDGGNITVRNAFGSNDVFRAQVTGSATYNIALTAGGDAHFLGDVGIGTSSPSKNIEIRTDANDEGILLKSTGSTSNALDLDANRSGAGNAIASIRGKWNGTTVAQIGFLAGADTTNKDDGVITFGTESAASNGNANATERMRIDSSGKVGIGTTSPGDFDDGADQLVISKAGACGLTIDSTSGTNSSIHFADGSTGNESYRGFIVYENGNDALKFGTSAEEAVRIDSSGRLLVGASTSPTSDVDIKMVIKSTGGPSIQFQRDDATTTSDNLLGRIVGTATDGSATPAAQIALRADGTHTASSSPGRIVFDTTADGDTATTERMRINSSGNIGIGKSPVDTNAFSRALDITGTSGAAIYIRTNAPSNSTDYGLLGYFSSDLYLYNKPAGNVRFYTNAQEKMRIDSSGRLLIGTSSNPTDNANGAHYSLLTSVGNTASSTGDGRLALCRGAAASTLSTNNGIGEIHFADSAGGGFASISAFVDASPHTNDYPGRLVFATTADGAGSPTERARITSAGQLGINITSPDGVTKLQVNNGTSATPGGANSIGIGGTGASLFATRITGSGNFALDKLHGGIWANALSINRNTGSTHVVGAFSKGSGSFRISHPLPSKTDTHHLVHSFIEGPQADLIYRGYVDLIDGQATVNIDTAARMTEGTFELLCTNVSCFTSNESDWTAVIGSVTGNVLTITAQDPTATSKVSWMVVGERKDQHMLDTDWTDDAGRVITEPEKVVEATEEPSADTAHLETD